MVVSSIHMRCLHVNLFAVYDLVVCGLHAVSLNRMNVSVGRVIYATIVCRLTISCGILMLLTWRIILISLCFVFVFFFLLFYNDFFLIFFHWFMFAFAWNDLYKIACNRFISFKLEFILQAHEQSLHIYFFFALSLTLGSIDLNLTKTW